MAPERENRPTRAERVRDVLADDIVSGRLLAGARLDEVGLAARFAVSRTPVREALRELAATGLVQVKAHLGAVVAPLAEDRLTQIFEAVAELEGLCARLCALNMSAAERRQLEQLHHHCGSLVRGGNAELYHRANAEFHAAIRNGGHNDVLQEMVAGLRGRFGPLSRAQFRSAGRLADSYAEHEHIVRAILRGNGNDAAQAARAHVLNVKRSFVDYAAMGGQAGAPETAAE
jgi:DNA-binding GntR family transcriptional regulator